MADRDEECAPSGPFYRPYSASRLNDIYNLLFCDDPMLLAADVGDRESYRAVLGATDRQVLERIGNNLDVDSRIRVLAFNRLRAMKLSVPPKRLLGAILEWSYAAGLDVLGVFVDERVTYLNYSAKAVLWQGASRPAVEKLMCACQISINRVRPDPPQPRLPPPPAGFMRISCLASDGLYSGQAPLDLAKQNQRFIKPIIVAAENILETVVETAIKKQTSPQVAWSVGL
jgi:hypothetical protein